MVLLGNPTYGGMREKEHAGEWATKMERRHGCREIRVIGGMIADPLPPVRETCKAKLHTNLGDPESYTGLEDSLEKLVKRVSLDVLGYKTPGMITSGATESNILSLYYWRQKGKKRVVVFDTVHYSVLKAAKLLGLETLILKTRKGYEPIIDDLERSVTEKDVIVVTIGTTETGYVDPVNEIYEIVKKKEAGLHIDAAFAGYIMRYLRKPVRIELDNVASTLAVDLHKIPEAPIPAGVLLASDNDVIESLYFESPYIPSKRQFGLLGSRPGCTVFAANVALDVLKTRFGDVENLAKELLSYTDKIVSILQESGYMPIHEVMTPIVCLSHEAYEEILKVASNKCIRLYQCPRHRGLRLAIMPHILWNVKLGIPAILEKLAKERGNCIG